MVRDKIKMYSENRSRAMVEDSSGRMKEFMQDLESKGADIDSPMAMITEIWNGDLSDYDAAQMICSIGIMLVKSGHYDEWKSDCKSEESKKTEDNMAALKKKWGVE